MARSVRDGRLDNRTGRLKLARGRRFQVTLRDGLALCYRRTAQGYGVWKARIEGVQGREAMQRIGPADDYTDADGIKVFTFFQAQDRARELAENKPLPAYTVSEAIDDYLAWFKENRRSVDETGAAIEAHIRPTLGDRAVASLTAKDLKAWRDGLARQKARKRTKKGKKQALRPGADEMDEAQREDAKRARRASANRIFAILRALLNKAFQDGNVRDDREWRRVKPFQKVDVPRIRFLTAAEAVRLVNACSSEFRPMMRAALLTGARYGELGRMTVGDFNVNTAQVYVAPSKSGKARYIPLNASGVELFKALTTGHAIGAAMFKRKDGTKWGKNHQQRPQLEACKRAEIYPALRFHELRHTYASSLAQAGADLLTISKLLGHADTRVTARHYAHLCDRTLANAVNSLLPAFGKEEPSNVAAIR